MLPAPEDLRALARRDPALGRALRALPAFPGFPSGGRLGAHGRYRALAGSIVHQQLAGAAAAAIWRRVCALGPRGRYPRPGALGAVPDAALRGAGLSGDKLAALRDLDRRAGSGALDCARLGRWDDQRVVAHLTQVRGVGEWTAQMFLLFTLGRLDVAAPGDLGVREGLRLLDELERRPSAAEALARCERWRPLRSVGTWAMWRIVDRERARRGG